MVSMPGMTTEGGRHGDAGELPAKPSASSSLPLSLYPGLYSQSFSASSGASSALSAGATNSAAGTHATGAITSAATSAGDTVTGGPARANMRYFGRATRFGCACIPLPAICSMLGASSCCSALRGATVALTAEVVFFAFRSRGEAPIICENYRLRRLFGEWHSRIVGRGDCCCSHLSGPVRPSS